MSAFDLSQSEVQILRRLDRPWKVQDFLEELRMNFRKTYHSPRVVLRRRSAACFEGALLAALASWYHGERPLLLDLTSTEDDVDHVLALYRWRGRWGACSKTNHPVLRYRDPIYRSIGELTRSYFHEYFLNDGRKTLLSYSTRPLDLRADRFRGWPTAAHHLDGIAEALDVLPHTYFCEPAHRRLLRRADPIERRVGKLSIWRR